MNNLKVWGTEIDEVTMRQAEKTARLSVLAGHLALMPDAHLGIGSTIGSVIPTAGAILPAAVGVDIGCGMIAVQTNLTAAALPDTLDPLVLQFGRSIPAGLGRGRDLGSKGLSARKLAARADQWMQAHPHELHDLGRAAVVQLGSLGSGNHFLELCLDENDSVWLMLHSGSRGIGNQLAHRHIKLAKAQHQAVEDPDLSYFLEGTPEFAEYISDMLWAQEYAKENREIMMAAALDDLWTFLGLGREPGLGREILRINVHHNYAAKERHQEQDLWITRKGAIRAARGSLGIIPGAMGTKSYITEGLGNPLSYESSSHGAGRRLSRGQAKRTLTVESLQVAMTGKAWNSDKAAALLDEHPESYKDIDTVMRDQQDLAKILHTLHAVANYKGV